MNLHQFSFLLIVLLSSFGVSCSETDNLIDTLNAPTASFALPFNNCSAPCTVVFTNKSLGVENQYLWYFGDGTTTTDFEPTHQYPTAGDYNITLSVTNNLGNSTTTKLLKVN